MTISSLAPALAAEIAPESANAFRSNFSKAVVNALRAKWPANLAGLTDLALADEVQAVVDVLLTRNRVTLSRSRPDYEAVLLQMMKAVESDSKVWSDLDISSTGQMILRLVASDVDYAQFSIARALQEAFIDTARADTSIYVAARSLGVKLSRNLPASVTVRLTRDDTTTLQTLDPYTQFTAENSLNGSLPEAIGSRTDFYSRDRITFNPAQIQLDVILYQGLVKSASVISSGAPFQIVEVGNETWNIASTDVKVIIGGVEWTEVENPLWYYGSQDKVFWQNTTPAGNIEIKFGNDIYGAAPPVGVEIKVQWVETLGAQAHSSLTGLGMTLSLPPEGLSTLAGVTQTEVTSGRDRHPAVFYKLFAPMRRAADDRAVRRADYRAHALDFPRIKDVRFRGQAELNPRKPSWTNVIGVTTLADPILSNQEWTSLVNNLTSKGIYQCTFLRLDPVVQDFNLTGTVYCRPDTNLDEVKNELIRQIRLKTDPKPNTLGFSWYKSDFVEMLGGEGWIRNAIQYVSVESPTVDMICSDVFKWNRLVTLTITMAYTRRDAFEGRLDRSISPPVDTNTMID